MKQSSEQTLRVYARKPRALSPRLFIAAFLAKSLASDILKLGQKGKVSIFISSEILAELKEKLSRKFKVNPETILEFEKVIEDSTILVEPLKKLKIIKRDPSDNIILECAVEAEADPIITMGKDLLGLFPIFSTRKWGPFQVRISPFLQVVVVYKPLRCG